MVRRKYTIQITVEEGADEFWEGLDPDTGERRGYATIEEVIDLVQESLDNQQIDVSSITPIKMETKYK